jgi:hypothetical protein
MDGPLTRGTVLAVLEREFAKAFLYSPSPTLEVVVEITSTELRELLLWSEEREDTVVFDAIVEDGKVLREGSTGAARLSTLTTDSLNRMALFVFSESDVAEHTALLLSSC